MPASGVPGRERWRGTGHMWLRHGAERTDIFRLIPREVLKLIAYNVNPYKPYLFTSGKCTLSSSLSR